MIFDIQDKFFTFLKVIAYITIVWIFLAINIVILLVAHSAIIAIQNGITLDEALTPLHSCIMNDDFIGTYNITRNTLFCELPFYSFINGIFVERSNLSYLDILYDTSKVALSGIFSYILCRFNLLLSSKKMTIIFTMFVCFWSCIALFSSILVITWVKTLTISNSIFISTIILILSIVILSFISFISLKASRVSFSLKRIMGENIVSLLMSTLDSLIVFLISCFSFDILHRYISDGLLLVMIVSIIGIILLYVYNFIKVNFVLNTSWLCKK